MLKRATADLAAAEPGAMEAQKQHLAAHIIPRCYVYDSSIVSRTMLISALEPSLLWLLITNFLLSGWYF